MGELKTVWQESTTHMDIATASPPSTYSLSIQDTQAENAPIRVVLTAEVSQGAP